MNPSNDSPVFHHLRCARRDRHVSYAPRAGRPLSPSTLPTVVSSPVRSLTPRRKSRSRPRPLY